MLCKARNGSKSLRSRGVLMRLGGTVRVGECCGNGVDSSEANQL